MSQMYPGGPLVDAAAWTSVKPFTPAGRTPDLTLAGAGERLTKET